MMLVVGPTGVGDGLVVLPAEAEDGPGTPFVGVGDGLGSGLEDGDGEGAPVAPVAPLAPVGPVAPTGVGDGLGSGLGDGEGAPVAPLPPLGPIGPVGPVLEVVEVSPDATAGTTMYIRANINSVAVSNPRVPDFILRGSDRPIQHSLPGRGSPSSPSPGFVRDERAVDLGETFYPNRPTAVCFDSDPPGRLPASPAARLFSPISLRRLPARYRMMRIRVRE